MRILVRLDGAAAGGGTPLIHHSEVLADPLSPEARWVAELSKKRQKTEAEIEELARREFMGGMYFDGPPFAVSKGAGDGDGLGPVMPTWNVVRSVQDAARMSKLGKKIERGVFPEEERVALRYDGPRTRDELWTQRRFALRKGVKLGQQRVIRTRAVFTDWSLEAVLVVDPFVIDFEVFEVVARQAGRYMGLGDFRSGRYGRYQVSCELLTTDDDLMGELAVLAQESDRKATATSRSTVHRDELQHQLDKGVVARKNGGKK